MFTIMREFSVLFLLITTLSSSETWIDVKNKKQKKQTNKNPDDISRNLIIRCLTALLGSVFHIILKLLALSHVTAKLADTMLGYSCCHNSSYLASDVEEDKVLLWARTKLLRSMFPVHKEKERKERFPFFLQDNHIVILSEGVCQKKSKPSQTDRVWKPQKRMERKHKTPARNATQNLGRWGKPEKRAKTSWKANWPFVPQRSSRSPL